MMEDEITVGVVGLGYWGPNLARNFSQISGCRLAALCDLDRGRLARMEKLHPGVPLFTEFDEMLAQPGLDSVVVATPLKNHFALAKAALTAGKHLLVEKPLASSVAECRTLIELAGRKQVTLMVGHTFLYSAAIEMIRAIIDSGELGDVRYINSQRLNFGLFQSDTNVVWDLAPHDLSIVTYLLRAMPCVVNCQGQGSVNPMVEDVANISLSFGDGRFATIQSSWLQPKKVRQMTIVGSRKMILYDDIEPMEKIRIYDTRVEKPPHYDSFGEFQYAYHYGDCYIPRIEQGEPLKTMCEEFVESAANGSIPASNGGAGLEVVRILEACSASIECGGGPIELDKVSRRSPNEIGIDPRGENHVRPKFRFNSAGVG